MIVGISFISNQHARANHPGLGDMFDISKLLSYIFLVECNNPYGLAMSQYLPTGGFKWIDKEKTFGGWEEFMTD